MSDAGRLRQSGRLAFDDEPEFLRSGTRRVVARGDTVWVERLWPREQVVVDVSDPAAPRIDRVLPRNTRVANAARPRRRVARS